MFNSATTLAGLFLWRRGIIKFRTEVGLHALFDVFVLLLAMDLPMYVQRHQDMTHNFGFYSLIWDRLWGTMRPDYAESFGRVPK